MSECPRNCIYIEMIENTENYSDDGSLFLAEGNSDSDRCYPTPRKRPLIVREACSTGTPFLVGGLMAEYPHISHFKTIHEISLNRKFVEPGFVKEIDLDSVSEGATPSQCPLLAGQQDSSTNPSLIVGSTAECHPKSLNRAPLDSSKLFAAIRIGFKTSTHPQTIRSDIRLVPPFSKSVPLKAMQSSDCKQLISALATELGVAEFS